MKEAHTITAPATGAMSSATDWLPVEAPLPMAAQDFAQKPKSKLKSDRRFCESDFWRLAALALTLILMTLVGVPTMEVLGVGGFSPLEVIAFCLFEILFGWITFSLVISLFGLTGAWSDEAELEALRADTALPVLTRRTAILMPIHNEDPRGVFARLHAMDASLAALRAQSWFDIFLLSDTRDSAILAAEQTAFGRLRQRMGQRAFYRHRPHNHGRKAGNIAEWVNRFGGAYDHMVVLDADSLMEGETLVRLSGAMQTHPRIGLIQTAPRLVNRASLFGRWQQFASRLYGPIMTHGLALFWGSEGNYWGHNAIIRVRAFAEQAGLPSLKGPRPFGGEISSHDFVEAALLRRAGWEVRIASHMPGSYEECPPTLPDMIARDRRWCQGNLQHLAIVAARGLHPMSRFHLIQGALGYLMSPLWFLFLIVSALLTHERAAAVSGEWDDYHVRVLLWVLSMGLACLFVPKIVALGLTLAKAQTRRGWGRVDRLVAGVLLELILSSLIAPIMMVSQTKALIDIALQRDSGWNAQSREDGSIGWLEAARKHALHTATGVVLAGFFLWVSPATLFWAAPVILGLLLSIPLAVGTADPALGRRFLGWKLFSTPEEATQSERAAIGDAPANVARAGEEGQAHPPRPSLVHTILGLHFIESLKHAGSETGQVFGD